MNKELLANNMRKVKTRINDLDHMLFQENNPSKRSSIQKLINKYEYLQDCLQDQAGKYNFRLVSKLIDQQIFNKLISNI